MFANKNPPKKNESANETALEAQCLHIRIECTNGNRHSEGNVQILMAGVDQSSAGATG